MKTKIALACLLMSGVAYATENSSVNVTTYSGYTLPFPGNAPQGVSPATLDNLLPYGAITAQDIYPLMVGYSLTGLKPAMDAGTYDGPFVANPKSTTLPIFSVTTPMQLALGAMLSDIPDNHIKDYYRSQPKVFASLTDLQKVQTTSGVNNSAASYAGANVGQSTNTYALDTGHYDAPYNAGSLFHYISADQLQKSPFASDFLAYQQNPGQVYIALASGGLTPPSATDSSPEYIAQTRRIAALQSAGVYGLQDVFSHSVPLKSNNPLVQSLQGYPGADKIPQNERDLEKFMATRRLDPASGWYQHIQQASPVELQREQLYLQAEMLYELHKVHETEEHNEMLLAANLLSNNYSSRLVLDQTSQVSAAKTKFSSDGATGQQKAGNGDNAAADFAKKTHLGS